MLKKADIILTVALIAIGLVMSYTLSFGKSDGDLLTVTLNGEKYGSYSLTEDREITVDEDGHTNKITIKDGVVSMSFSNCHGQDCVDSRDISQSGENIICLPHKLVLEITGGEGQYDSISK
jgi:hypothetical protein